MTAQDFVKEEYPRARVERYSTNSPFGESYWLCWSQYRGKRLSEGKTASNAWVNAAKGIRNK